MNLRFIEPCDSCSFGFDTLSSVSLDRRTLRTTPCLTSACCWCFSHLQCFVEHLVSHLLGTAVPVCRCNDTMVLIFIPNIFLIIFITHDIKVKTVDEQPFIFDEFLTLFVKSLGSRVVVDYLSSKSPQSLTESAFQTHGLYLGAGNPTQGPP